MLNLSTIATDTSKLTGLLNSPEGQIVVSLLKERAVSDAEQIVEGFVLQEIKSNPAGAAAASPSTLATTVEGDLWHYLRRKWGFMGFTVDIIRNVPTTEEPVRAFVTQVVELTIAQQAAPFVSGIEAAPFVNGISSGVANIAECAALAEAHKLGVQIGGADAAKTAVEMTNPNTDAAVEQQ